jgi:molecular chaperone Hsp33
VLLDGHSLAATLETYFRQSEQLPTRLWLVANSTQAAGLLLQTIPSHADNEKNLSEWQTIEYLANTLSEIELLNLDCESLLHRLFHQYPLRLFAAESIEFACHCSREKTQASLLTLGIEELIELAQKQEMITVDCQFCGQSYAFNQTDIQSLIQNNMKHH